MKFKVKSRFRDKITRTIYNPGDSFETDDENRIKMILDGDLCEPEEKKQTKEDICKLLDEKGISYDSTAKKDELLLLLGGE
ncbi:MAG: hypothetical protein JXR88_12525 [Clostridia bacterium]|nr:hypothetical protein [Clostridia bacterium]